MFQNYHRQLRAPFVIYAGFESITEKVSGDTPNNNNSYTEAFQKHTDCSYAYKVVSCYDNKYTSYDDKYTKQVQGYRGKNAVYKFMEKNVG